MCVGAHLGQKEGVGSPKIGVTGCCEPPNVGAGRLKTPEPFLQPCSFYISILVLVITKEVR